MNYYTALSIIGIMVGWLVGKAINMPKPSKSQQLDIYIACVIGILIGMKVPVWLSYGMKTELFLYGKSFMGGVLGAFVSLNVYKYINKQKNQSFGGRFVIPLAIAAGFGKIGCYINGCCVGHFILPTQLVESFFQFSIALALYIFYRKTDRTDLLFPIYILGYLVMRFLIEFVREEPRILLGLTIYQILSIIFIPIIVTILCRRGGKNA